MQEELDVFGIFQTESYDEAKKRQSEEASRPRINRFSTSEDGEYNIRILPLAPVKDAGGNWTMPRNGYEYPLRSLVLPIQKPDTQGKKGLMYANAVNARLCGFSCDLIDTYIATVKEKYAGDEEIVKKVTTNSFSGGLRWNYSHACYVIDCEKPKDGILIYEMSNANYKALEDEKFSVWNELIQGNPSAAKNCPVSSLNGGFPVKIKRKTDKKTEYSITLNTLRGPKPIEKETLDALLELPRINEQVYRFTRYNLEAEIEYLKQYEEKFDLDVLNEPAVVEVIEKLKMELPQDDTSHFSFDRNSSNDGNGGNDEITIDSLWDEFEALADSGKGDKSDEGVALRDKISAFIEDNDLDVRVSRKKTTKQLLQEIEEELNEGDEEDEEVEEAPEAVEEPAVEEAPEEEPAEEDEDDEQEENPREHNDDTNEPALRPTRERTARPASRRR